jgi:hypothetical protein
MAAAVGFVRGLPDEFYLRHEVADALGVSAATLDRLGRSDPDHLGPCQRMMFGGLQVLLYDRDRIERLHAHLAEHRSRRGRPRLWSDEERRARRAAYSALGYRCRRAKELRARGDHAEGDRMQHLADQLAAELRHDHDRRSAHRRSRRGSGG